MNNAHSFVLQEKAKKLYLAGDYLLAKEAAFEWARLVSFNLNIDAPLNWKFFKRNICHRFFGKIDNKRFSASEKETLISHIMSNLNTDKRISFFPSDKACRSRTFFLNDENLKEILRIIDTENIDVEVFVDFGKKEINCFRRYFSEYEDFAEVGKGSAHLVYENERGKTKTIVIERGRVSFESRCDLELEKATYFFIKNHELHVDSISKKIVSAIGVQYIVVEGYFDIASRDFLSVVDIDLPLDYVFFV